MIPTLAQQEQMQEIWRQLALAHQDKLLSLPPPPPPLLPLASPASVTSPAVLAPTMDKRPQDLPAAAETEGAVKRQKTSDWLEKTVARDALLMARQMGVVPEVQHEAPEPPLPPPDPATMTFLTKVMETSAQPHR